MIIIDSILNLQSTSSSTLSGVVKIPSQDAVVLVLAGTDGGLPTTVSVNGSRLVKIGSVTEPTSGFSGTSSAWIMRNPPVGSYPISIKRSSGSFSNASIFVLLGVDKKTININFTSTTTTTSSWTLNPYVAIANSLLLDVFFSETGSAPTADTPDASQEIVQNDPSAPFGTSYKYVNPGIQKMTWTATGGTSIDTAYLTIILEPADAPSFWQPNIKLRNQLDVVNNNNLNTATSARLGTFGYFPSQFFQNSFLHTIGRMIHISSPTVAKSVNGLFNSSRIIIDRITQSANTGASTLTIDHNVYSEDSVLVIFASLAGVGASLSSTTLNGQTINSLATDTVSTLVGGLYFVTNPRVGVNTITVTSGVSAALQIIAISLLGVDKKTSNPIFVSANGATGSPSSVITPTASNSLIIDFVGTLLGNGTPDASQYQYFQQPQSTSGAFGSIKLAGTSAQTMSWTTTGAAWTQLIIALEPAQAASMWNPNIDLRSIIDVIGPAGMNTKINPTGNFAQVNGYHSSTYFQNSFLHTVGRMRFAPKGKGITGSTLLLMGVG